VAPGATIARANAYVEAGADGVFVPGVGDPDLIRELASAIHAPLNIMAGADAPGATELRELELTVLQGNDSKS